MFFFGNLIFLLLTIIICVGSFFMFDEAILNGYFATKLRQRFDVENLKDKK